VRKRHAVNRCAPASLPFPRKLGIPSWDEILAATQAEPVGPCRENRPNYPIHCKKIPIASLESIDALALEAPTWLREQWKRVRPILTDPAMYAPFAEPEPATLLFDHSTEQLNEMVEKGLVELHGGDSAVGWVRKKGVCEQSKKRWRLIDHTTTANKAPRTIDLELNSMAHLQTAGLDGTHGIIYDFTCFFHAFAYANDVTKFFCFRGPDGSLYHLNRLAMGQTHACDLAHTVSLLIATVAAKREARTSNQSPVSFRVHIDNGLLVGSPVRISAVFQEVQSICNHVGIIINDDAHTPSTEVDFAGVHLDFTNKTVRVTEKVRAKATHMLQYLEHATEISNLALASIVGLGLHFHTVVRANGYPGACPFWKALRHYRGISRQCTTKALWLSTGTLAPGVRKDIVAWLHQVAYSNAVPILDMSAPIDFGIAIDASANEYGALVVNLNDNKYHIIHRAFPAALKASVDSESLACAALMDELTQLTKGAHCAIYSDHRGLRDAFTKGFSPHPGYNRAILALKKPAAMRQITFKHIKGSDNPADEISRGKPPNQKKIDDFISLLTNT